MPTQSKFLVVFLGSGAEVCCCPLPTSSLKHSPPNIIKTSSLFSICHRVITQLQLINNNNNIIIIIIFSSTKLSPNAQLFSSARYLDCPLLFILSFEYPKLYFASKLPFLEERLSTAWEPPNRKISLYPPPCNKRIVSHFTLLFLIMLLLLLFLFARSSEH